MLPECNLLFLACFSNLKIRCEYCISCACVIFLAILNQSQWLKNQCYKRFELTAYQYPALLVSKHVNCKMLLTLQPTILPALFYSFEFWPQPIPVGCKVYVYICAQMRFMLLSLSAYVEKSYHTLSNVTRFQSSKRIILVICDRFFLLYWFFLYLCAKQARYISIYLSAYIWKLKAFD